MPQQSGLLDNLTKGLSGTLAAIKGAIHVMYNCF